MFEKEHLLHRRIDDDISRGAFATYLDRLDHNKLFLLKADRDTLARTTPTAIDDELRAGSLDLAHDGEKSVRRARAVVDKMVAELLSAPFNLTKDETIETDPKKYDFAATDDELRDRWRQRLELFEVLERIATMEDALHPETAGKGQPKGKDSTAHKAPPPPPKDIPTTPEARQEKARTEIAKSYSGRFARLEHPGALDGVSEVINAIAANYDPHTDYLPPSDKATSTSRSAARSRASARCCARRTT